MKLGQFIDQYQKFLEINNNPARAVKEKAYLYSDLKHYGLASGLRNKFFKTHKKELKQLSKIEVLELVESLWELSSFEEKILGLDVLVLHAKKLNIDDMPLLEKLMRESRGWALLDNFVIQIMPEILTKNKKAYSYLSKWIEDNDFWVRRSALLAQLLFFRKGEGGDKRLFFDLAQSQFEETWIDKLYQLPLERKRSKFFIRKAIGWCLREMSAKDPETVFNFLNKYKDYMSGLSFREGSRKLPKEMKVELGFYRKTPNC